MRIFKRTDGSFEVCTGISASHGCLDIAILELSVMSLSTAFGAWARTSAWSNWRWSWAGFQGCQGLYPSAEFASCLFQLVVHQYQTVLASFKGHPFKKIRVHLRRSDWVSSLRVCIDLRNFGPCSPEHKMYSLLQVVRYMKLRPYTLQYIIGKESDVLSLYLCYIIHTLAYIDGQ